MQSFRERGGGYHSNQPCYQQEPHELSRLETYRQHPHHAIPQHPLPGPGPHPGPSPGHTRPVYEAHSLVNPTTMPAAGGPGGGPKDCYSQQAYPGYPGNGGGTGIGNGGSAPAQAKKPYRGSKVPPTNPGQHLQGYSNHMGPGNYSAQYISEGHLQQKWEDPAQLAQYEQEMVGRMEAAGTPTPGSSQYMDQNMLGHSQTQCHQPTTPSYTSPHHTPHTPNPSPSPLMYPQSHLHYPQHSPSPSPYMEKCSPMPHCYKGYNIAPNSQYGRQMSSHGNLKQGGYRSTQSSYGYQQPPSRGYEHQPPLQAMTNPQEPHPKYQHYSQPQQNYCLSELSVRSPEQQYYQTCSPSSSHSPARSVGRSPSYSSTPSPLMTNPESFQYSQPPMTPGAASSSSSSSAGIQEQGNSNAMLMPPRSHPSPNVPHAAPHSYTTTPQGPTMKERFSEKLLSNPSLWSLNALTSQVENISNNVQQLLLSEALVANKKASKRSSGGSNSSVGSAASSKKGEEYKSPYPDSGGSASGGPMQDPYSTPQHQPMQMELHEGGYSSSSDEQLERGYYYSGQGRSPAQAPNNTHHSLDTVSSCSMTSPDDLSTRSGDSGLHNLTPDPIRSQSGQGGDGMSTPVKSIGDERSPLSIIPSPMKHETDSPSDIQHIDEPVKENFEESAWTEKSADKEEETREKTPDCERHSDITKPTETLDKWSDDEKSDLYSKINEGVIEKDYSYEDTVYQGVHGKYESDARDSVEQSPAALSDSSHKEHFGQEMKSDTYKSECSTASESSMKTLPFFPRSDLEQDQYSTEKEDSSENTSPTPHIEALDEKNSDKRESTDEVDYEEDEEEGEEEEEGEREEETDEEEDEIQEQKQRSLSPPLSAEVREETGEGEKVSQSSTVEHMNNGDGPEKHSGDHCGRKESQSTELRNDNEFAGAPAHPNAAAVDASARESAIGDTAPQPQSAMPVFSALNDKTTPPAQARDHIDHSDAKVLEPDSPQLPGKSILPSAPSWADTPPSPKKGDEDMEPGISCSSAVTPLAKPEPVAPSAQPRAFGRKHVRGRRTHIHSGVGIRRQLRLEREGEKEEEGATSPTEKPCMPESKTALFSDQMDLTHQESIVSQTPKMITDGFRSRMCTRSFNASDLPSKVEPHGKRKPGPKPGLKSGPKPGPKPGPKSGGKPGARPGPKPVFKPGPKPSQKPSPKTAPKPVPNMTELSVKIDTPIKRKPGPKPGPKSGPKPTIKPGQKPAPKAGPKPADDLPPTDPVPIKAPVGRPKGSVSKAKQLQQDETIQPLTGLQSRVRKTTTIPQLKQDLKLVNQEDKQTTDIKAQDSEGKNMVLRSRKPSQLKFSKEKERVIEEEILQPTLKETETSDVCPKDEPLTVEETLTPVPNDVKDSDVPADHPATHVRPLPNEHTEEKTLLPIKRKSCAEPSTIPVKKKRGPKPKTKSLPPQSPLLEQVVSTATERKKKGVRGPKRKRGPTKKASEVTKPPKHIPPNIGETDTSDVPVVPPQCPTKTKVLPPRKGRGQKYEAMVQKNSSPSSKKHLQLPQIDSNLNYDPTSKALSKNVLKEGETSGLVNSAEMMEGEAASTESRPEEVKHLEGAMRKDEVKQERENYETIQEASPSEEARKGEAAEVVNEEDRSQGNIKPETPQDFDADKSQSSIEAPVDVGGSQEWAQHAVADVSTASSKSSRIKRKRWAMVESTDASVVALEAGSLIVTTPRLAKQRAIKNNHEMHLKQKRKKKKGPVPLEETEAVKETNIETAEQQETEDEMITPIEASVPLPSSVDEITEPHQVTNTELTQKSRRGRKPSENPTKRKRGKTSSEQISGKPMKVHKKPGPKPGMKDAIEVIEAVVRAAGCEQDEKEERERQEKERTEDEKEEKEIIVGPVVTVSEKQSEIISVKRIRRKPVQQNSKLSFCPYVRINNSRDFSSWCAIVNRPEDAVIFQRRRKKGILRMKNPFTVAKTVPHTAAMLQGPLVNTNLIGRCLTCCLCGMQSNYRDLGDLCGPYYTEEGVPRKMLTIGHTQSLKEVPEKTDENNSSGGEETGGSSKNEDEGGVEKEGSAEVSTEEGGSTRHNHWRYRRAERPERMGRGGGPRRLTLQERFKRMRQLQDISTGFSNEQEGSGSVFQRLQGEAEAKEHWAHENCAIWTKGVLMVAGRLYGLKEAANNSAQTSCYKCKNVGASLSCCWRGCSHKYHYVCAKEIGCTFHEDDFSIKCPKHEDL